MKRLCVKCEVEFRCEKVGVIVKEMMNQNTRICRLWRADLWKCPKCGFEIVVGFGDGINKPFYEHFDGEVELKALIEEYKKKGVKIYTDNEILPKTNFTEGGEINDY